MAWNIAGVDRRTRDAAVEAARRAGMRLDDWLDEVITDYAGLDQHARPEHEGAEVDRLDAAAGRLERIARRNERVQAPRASAPSDGSNSAIERFEVRLARAEAQAARAFETVAEILDRGDAARDSDRRALIEAVRRLESIRATLTDVAQTGEKPSNRFPPPGALDPKAPFDLKAAVSQIAMRRHELEERAGRGETRCEIRRDFAAGQRFPSGLEYRDYDPATLTIRDDDPLSCAVGMQRRIEQGRGDWRTRIELRSQMTADATDYLLSTSIDAYEGDTRVHSRTFTSRVPRDHS